MDLFYADDGMVASSDPCWLQGAFNTLVSLFDSVGLWKNVGNTFGIVCHPCQAARNLLEAAYGRRFIGEGPTYRERLKGQVACRECKELLEEGSLTIHLMTQHGSLEKTQQRWSTPAAGAGPQPFIITFPEK